mgnify:CR=1 FL=1
MKNYYLSISHGHKAGGFNQNPYINESNRLYNPEYNSNLDLGLKANFSNLILNLNLFYMYYNILFHNYILFNINE